MTRLPSEVYHKSEGWLNSLGEGPQTGACSNLRTLSFRFAFEKEQDYTNDIRATEAFLIPSKHLIISKGQYFHMLSSWGM